MSMKHLAWAMTQRCDTAVDKLILIYVGDAFDRDGERQKIDVQNISEFVNCSPDLVMRSLAMLSNEGVIRMHGFGGGFVELSLSPGRSV